MPLTIQDSSTNPYHWEPFRRCWFEHLAEKEGVQAQAGDYVIYHKRMARGLLHFKELKFYAGIQSWFQ